MLRLIYDSSMLRFSYVSGMFRLSYGSSIIRLNGDCFKHRLIDNRIRLQRFHIIHVNKVIFGFLLLLSFLLNFFLLLDRNCPLRL